MKVKREALVSEYITDALLMLMRKKDYKDISITEICEKAGVTRMSFYRNFESKEGVLKKWIKSITDTFLMVSEISYKNDNNRDYFIKLFTHMKQHKAICAALYKADLIYLVKEQFDRGFLSIYHDEYDDYKSYFLAGGIYNVFLLWLMNGCTENPEGLADRMNDILIR